MNYKFHKYYILNLVCGALLYMVLAFGLSSCSLKDINLDYEDSKNGFASMEIFLGMDSRSSSSEEGFEEGVGYENYIDIPNGDYGIYFFDSDGKYIDSFHPIYHSSNSPDNFIENNGLLFYGYVSPEIGSKFKIVVLANWKSNPDYADSFSLVKGSTTIKQISTHLGSRFAYLTTPENDGQWLGMDRLMRFYGVRSFDLTHSHPNLVDEDGKILSGRIVDLKAYPIPLIRAMARVEVIMNNPLASFESVEITKVHEKGFSAPYRESDDWKFDYSDYYSETGGWTGNYMRGVHLVLDSEISPLSLTKVSERTENADGTVTPEKWVAYMPEYKNIGVDDDDMAAVHVGLKKPSVNNDAESLPTVDDNLYYKDIFFTKSGKKDGARFDVERNNVYRFIIDGMDGEMQVSVDVQPYAQQDLSFAFGLMRDSRGDLMVLPDENGNYPDYFIGFINDDNPNHKYPHEEDENGNPGKNIVLEEGDYYAIVVGEYQEMSDAVVWVKDKDGCHVLSNFGSNTDDQKCRARLVESFFGNNQSEKFYKDVFGYRRVYHFDNHNSIVRDPRDERLLFCVFDDFEDNDQSRKYYEVESWDDNNKTGWIINKDADGNEVGFQKINEDGTLGESIPINVDESTD